MISDINSSIKNLFEQLDKNNGGSIFIVDGSEFLGTVTDGDLRRALIHGFSLDDGIENVLNTSPVCCIKGAGIKNLAHCLLEDNYEEFPYIEPKRKFIRSISREEIKKKFNDANCGVIMAGGLGKRLGAITENTPKPLLKVGEEPIISLILKRFKKAGILNILISVNYLSEMIINYCGDGSKFGLNIVYLKEDKRLGTAGAISLIDGHFENYIICNADILSDIDISHFALDRFAGNFDASAAIVLQENQIPYGVVAFDENKKLGQISEKPKQKFWILSGMYSISQKVKDLVPHNEYTDMPTLLQKAKENDYSVGCYNNEYQWIDVGTPETYAVAEAFLEKLN